MNSSARNKRYRKNKSRRMRCVTIRVTDIEIDRLLKSGHLQPGERQNRQAVAEAVEAFVSDSFERVDAL
jgi:hypothetical protein